MIESKLTVTARSATGKGNARRTRAQGLIPGICYGRGTQPIPVALDPTLLVKALSTPLKENTVIDMTINANEDGQKPAQVKVMLKDYQLEPIRRKFAHVDFVQVRMDEAVTVNIPLILLGKPEGVKFGGVLHQVYRFIPVAALPAAIPDKIEIDVSKLNLNDAVKVADLTFTAGVKALLDTSLTVANVTAPQEEKAPVKEEAAEAEAAAAPAAAAGGKDAKGAAPAAAGGKDAKAGEAAKGGDAKGGAKPAEKKK